MDAWHDSRTGTESASAPLSGQLSIQVDVDDASAEGGTSRRADRISIDLDAGLRQRGAAAVSVHIRDLSTHGFRIVTHLELAVGTDVWLRLPGLEASLARVMWVDGNLAGCAFDRPLHPAVLELVVKRAGGG